MNCISLKSSFEDECHFYLFSIGDADIRIYSLKNVLNNVHVKTLVIVIKY